MVVTRSLVAFGLTLETLGLVLAIFLLVAIASFATRDLKAWETLAAAAGLAVLTWAIFVPGSGCRSRSGRTGRRWSSSSATSPPDSRSR